MVLDGRGLGQDLFTVETGVGLVSAQDVGYGHGMGRRGYTLQVEGGDIGGVVEHFA